MFNNLVVPHTPYAGEDPDYSNLGKLIIKDMKDHGDSTYAKGTIWDPVKDKVYKSKLEVKGMNWMLMAASLSCAKGSIGNVWRGSLYSHICFCNQLKSWLKRHHWPV